MTLLPRIHTLGEYRDAIETTADYIDAGTGSQRAQTYLALGLVGEIGAVADEYRKAARRDHGELTDLRLGHVKDAMSSALWYITRAVVEHGTDSAGLLWGHSIADLQIPAHVDSPVHAWLYMPRLLVMTDFTKLHDVQVMLRALAVAAARHGWTLQDLGWHCVTKQGAGQQAISA
jgi:hypothetical protein